MDQTVASLFTPGHWPTFVLISTRLTGLMLMAPFWSLASIPRTVRGAIVVVLAALLVPLSPKAVFPAHILEIPVPLMSEMLIGLGIGLAAAVVMQALMLASEVVALQTGLSLGQVIAPSVETGGPALSQLYGLLGLAVFVSVGGPTELLAALARSLALIPPGAMVVFGDGPLGLLSITGHLFADAMQIAGPVMVAVTVANVAVAIINRAVPQLNAMAMSFAVTLGVGLIMLGVTVPLLTRAVSRWSAEASGRADQVVELLRGERGR